MINYQDNCNELKRVYHSSCIFNKIINNKYDIYFTDDGSLVVDFYCHDIYQGYDDMMHGGILAALIDSAMTRCLFGHGIVGYTVRLNIKYIKPVKIDTNIKVYVNLKNHRSGIYYKLFANIFQEGDKKISATAIFWVIDRKKSVAKNQNDKEGEK